MISFSQRTIATLVHLYIILCNLKEKTNKLENIFNTEEFSMLHLEKYPLTFAKCRNQIADNVNTIFHSYFFPWNKTSLRK